ncbi:MAG: anthranilate synthase component I family protein [Planctomycetota bacterium]
MHAEQPQIDTPLHDHAPCVVELSNDVTVMRAWHAFAGLDGCLLLDSSTQEPESLGRYSFLMADPFEVICEPVGSEQPLERLRQALRQFNCNPVAGLPPMQGGAAGVFAYDLNHSFESIPKPRHDDFHTPAIVVGLYDVVIAWDHLEEKAWLISQGFPETDTAKRLQRAESRSQFFLDRIHAKPPSLAEPNPLTPKPLTTPQFAVGNETLKQLTSNFSRQQYVEAVQQCIDYIYAGDVFQINLSQQLMVPATFSGRALYEQLRNCNASTFGGYFDIASITDNDLEIISASPERLFSVRGRSVETRPIKGTRPRTGHPVVDFHEQGQLISSEKDRAENTMIVDLMRNDLSSVCDDDSIRVTQWCQLEAYRSVLHLVSAVEGTLKVTCDVVDLLAAVFPGGSITGAPKVRAMEIIAEQEPTARGFYCGSMGYLSFTGDADLNILIRTITASSGWWQVPVGGGIVSQSDPQNEYEETWTKAMAMLNAIKQNGHCRVF